MPGPAIPLSYPLLRGGQRLPIVKLPDEFTIRSVPGADEQAIGLAFGCELQERLSRQRLSILSVPAGARDPAMDALRGRSEVLFASHVYSLWNDPFGRIYLTDELTVEFRPEVSLGQIEVLMQTRGLSYVADLAGVEGGYVFRLNESASDNPLKLADALDQLDEVIRCEANVAFRSQPFYTPSDSLFRKQWHLFHEGGLQLEAGSHVDITRAWDITRGSRSTVLAVIDDAIDMAHRDLNGPGKIVAPRDYKGFDFNPSPEGNEESHGTACAGVAVAEENGQGVVGAAPGCALMPIRTPGIIDDNLIEAVFHWAVTNGAAVISNSWGPFAINIPLSRRQYLAIQKAATEGRNGKGCVICFAAGNANRPVSGLVEEQGWPNGEPQGPAFWQNGFAAHPDVIAVSACTSLNKKAAYSNWGKEISVCAPSDNTHPSIGQGPTYPRMGRSFPGRGIVTTDRVGAYGYEQGDYTTAFGGTSSACALVAGVAALVLTANPGLTAREVREILQTTTDKPVDTSADPQLGMACGTYDEQGHSLWFGYGKVNAFKAASEARRRLQGEGASQSVNARSAPGLAIPDNDFTGLSDIISIAQEGVLRSLDLNVHINHSYIGDLRVSLVAPSGQTVVLHDRKGGGKNNIRRTFTSSDTAALGELTGTFIAGDWRLLIQDLAPRDAGRLEEWSLSVLYDPSNVIRLKENPGALIPDADPEGIRRTFTLAQEGTVKKISVSVDISHTFIADLQVSLRSPEGTQVMLHDRKGGGTDNLVASWHEDKLPALAQFKGQHARGEWVLQVRDLAQRDTGKINAWSILLEWE